MPADEVLIPVGDTTLEGTLEHAGEDNALVIFAHGSGSSRHSPRNQRVAAAIREAGIDTLLFDLLTADEESFDAQTARLRFDIALLARRLEAATEWAVAQHAGEKGIAIGYFGASTGAAAALIAASRLRDRVSAVVSRGGRPDLAGPVLDRVVSPTLLIVGEHDREVIVLNEQALSQLACEKQMAIVPRATHLFEEAGALDKVSDLATAWFRRHLLDEKVQLRAAQLHCRPDRGARP